MMIRPGNHDPQWEGYLHLALNRANEKYDGNLMFNDGVYQKGRGYSVRLNVRSSYGPGARLGRPTGPEGKQRRIRAACWHAYRDYLRELFNLDPDAVVTTGMARYEGAHGFELKFPATYDQNAGSIMQPVAYGDLCACDKENV